MKEVAIIDDSESCRLVGKHQFENLGFNTNSFEFDFELIDAMNKNQFSLIMMDILMPANNGVELLKIIKDLFPIVPPVIAISTDDMLVNSRNFKEFGFKDFIQKPLTKEKLEKAIENSLNNS